MLIQDSWVFIIVVEESIYCIVDARWTTKLVGGQPREWVRNEAWTSLTNGGWVASVSNESLSE